MASNNAKLVSTGKPKVGGALYYAPVGTPLPTAADSELNAAFVNVGYAAEDGFKNENTPSSEEIKAWGGDVVKTLLKEKPDKFKVKLIQVLDVDVLKVIYGPANVTGDLDTGIVVRANSNEPEEYAWVCDMIMTDNVMKRIVIPDAKMSDLGELEYVDNDITGYDIELTAFPGGEDFDYDTHKEYIKKKSSTTTGHNTSSSGSEP